MTRSHDGNIKGEHVGAGNDAWIVNLNQEGSLLWQKCLGGNGSDQASSIIHTRDGGYAFTGSTVSMDGDVTGYHLGYDTLSRIQPDTWTVKLNSSGAIQWQKCLGGTGDDYANSIIQTSDGGYIFAGHTTSSDGDVIGYHHPDTTIVDCVATIIGANNMDAWIVKFDSTGAIEWKKCYGGLGNDEAYSIIQTPDGGYIFAGSTTSKDGDVSGLHGGSDVWLVKLNVKGNILWQECLGGTNSELATSLVQASDGRLILAGYTNSSDGDVSGLHQAKTGLTSDFWVVKLEAPSDHAICADIEQSKLSFIFPNPSTEKANIRSPRYSSLQQIKIYDLMGIQHSAEYHLENDLASISVCDLSNGTYIARVTYELNGLAGYCTLSLVVQH